MQEYHTENNIKPLTTGLSMMPLRKMRSRSLAVVELVLSLSVSKAWCMAAHEHTHTHTGKTNFIYFSCSTFCSCPWETDWIQRVYTTQQNKYEEEWGRRGRLTFFPRQFHLCHSASSKVCHKWQYLSPTTPNFLSSSYTQLHIHTETVWFSHWAPGRRKDKTDRACENLPFDLTFIKTLYGLGWI